MLKVRFYKNKEPVKVDWLENEKGNLDLYINNEKQPLEIELVKSSIGASIISARYNGKICGTSAKFKLGHFKKRLLASFYKISSGYEEVWICKM